MPNTDDLIRNLSRDLKPAPPLRSPLLRCAVWMAGSFAYMALLVAWMTPADSLASRLSNGEIVVQQLGSLAMATAAAAGAFWMTVPGYRRTAVVPIAAAAAAWLGIVIAATIRDWMAAGSAGLALRSDWPCVAGIVMTAAVPGLAMAVMLRRGAPVAPRAATALGALAVAGLANVGMCLAQPHERAVIVLVWHGLTIAALAALGALAGRSLLKWDHRPQAT